MDRKIIMGVAAVAGIGLLLYMRKKGDQSTLTESSSLVSAVGNLGSSAGSAWSSQPIVIDFGGSKGPAKVNDSVAAAPAPPPPAPPPPKPAALATWGAGPTTKPIKSKVPVNTPAPTPQTPSGAAVWGGTVR